VFIFVKFGTVEGTIFSAFCLSLAGLLILTLRVFLTLVTDIFLYILILIVYLGGFAAVSLNYLFIF